MTSLLKKIFRPLRHLRPGALRDALGRWLVSRTVTVHGEPPLRFIAYSSLLEWRAHTLHSKEPETIAWIGSFEPNAVLYDIGANVGIYSIFAAAHGVKVFAFEPEAENYRVLNRNIELNQLSGLVTAYCVAITDHAHADMLMLSQRNVGAALHAFGAPVDYAGRTFEPAFRQGSIGLAIDDLVSACGLPVPNYIKIDVDGLESRVLAGATHTLADPRLRGLLVEINEQLVHDRHAIEMLRGCGLHVVNTGVRIEDSAQSYSLRNYIFARNTV